MSNITFLFGAGAEQKFGLSGGEEFALNLLGIVQDEGTYRTDRTKKNKEKHINSKNLAIKEYYSQRLDKNTWYPNHKNDTWSLDQLVECAIKKSLVEDSFFKNNKEFLNETERIYNSLFQDNGELDFAKCHEIIKNNTSYIGLLDSAFHTIICPTILGSDTFWRVANCYNRAYLLINKEKINAFKKHHKQYVKTEKHKKAIQKVGIAFCCVTSLLLVQRYLSTD